MRKLTLAILGFFFSGCAFAFCSGGKYPNIGVAEEMRESDFIVIGTLSAMKIVVDPVEDPEGYEAQLFQVKISKILRGTPPKYAMQSYFTVFNVNTSARFPIGPEDLGKQYLLFVRSSPDGYWINSCGNSDELDKSAKNLWMIERLSRAGNKKFGAKSP
jgi:hypothetical protein